MQGSFTAIEENTNMTEANGSDVQVQQQSIVERVKEKIHSLWTSVKNGAKSFVKLLKKFYKKKKPAAEVEEDVDSVRSADVVV